MDVYGSRGRSRRSNERSRSRRSFVKSLTVGLAGALAPRGRGFAADGGARGAIDTHTHFYDPTRPQGVPWPGKDDALLYRPVLPGELVRLTRAEKVSGTIVVEASTWLEDNQWLLDLAAREPFIVGIVGRLDTNSDDFEKHLTRFARDRLFRGLRINHDELQAALERPAQLDHLRLLADNDLELDVNGGPTMPADVARLARAIPSLRIVVNHAANLMIDGRRVPDEWLAGMRAAAAGERVYCKVSALVEGTRKTHGDAPADVDFYRPVLDSLWNVFGADRLLYGSNWPVSERAAPYATVYQIAHAYFQQKGERALEKFLRTNAIAAYRPVERG
ncbi:MAG TPA: amidohydrolase family protein [Pirellulales bacterium]|nr:amidohydrolase family protein [Pirellulales bacterium]